jgi:signal transduction histidine kinase/HAMP domain-containing protein
MTLRGKFNLLAAIAIGVLLLVATGLRITHQRLVDAEARQRAADRLVLELFELNSLTYDYLLNGSPRARDQWRLMHARATVHLHEFGSLTLVDRPEIVRIERHLAAAAVLFQDLTACGNLTEAGRPAARERHLAAQLSLRTEDGVSAASRMALEDRSRAIRLHRQNDMALSVCLGLLAVLILIAPVLVDRTFVRPLARLNRGIAIIGRGNLDHRVATGTADEIGALANAIDAMTASLRTITASRDELDREITERTRVADALRANEGFLEAVFHSIQDGISVLDKNLRILRANDSMRRWYPDAVPLEGKLCFEAYQQSSVPCEVCPTRKALATGELHAEMVPLRQAGRIVGWLEIFAFPMKNAAGEITGVVEFVRDITERQRAEDALRRNEQRLREQNEALARSNAELDDFAYVASHDLREPLRGIARYAEFLIEDYGGEFDEEGRRRLDSMARLCKREDALIESLLHYSRVGRTELAVKEVDLNDLLTKVIDALESMLAAGDVEIRVPEPLPPVVCDGVRVGEVFHNLISNAIKYNARARKLVEIGVASRDSIRPPGALQDAAPAPGSAPGDEIVFYVRDNGIGIREQHQEKVFKIFKRLHGRDEYGGGSGAGLTIVKKIVERHGGRIWLESAPGEGTTFYFTLGSRARAAVAA